MRKYRNIKRKLKGFGKGTVRGLSSLILAPTTKRIEEENNLGYNKYETAGFMAGFYGTIMAGLSISPFINEKKSLLAFSVVLGTNLLSASYEGIRNRIKARKA